MQGLIKYFFNQAKKFGDLNKGAGKYLKIMKGLGWASGIYSIGENVNNLIQKPNLYNGAKLSLSIISIANPWLGLGIGIMEATGGTDFLLQSIGLQK